MNELIDSDDFDENPVRYHGIGKGAFTVAFQPFDKLGVWGLGSAIPRYPVLHGVQRFKMEYIGSKVPNACHPTIDLLLSVIHMARCPSLSGGSEIWVYLSTILRFLQNNVQKNTWITRFPPDFY